MSRSIREYREMISTEDVIRILKKFDVDPVRDTTNYIVYPTVDHNLVGGSPKLYYYKKDKMFKSYTGEQRLFDIFQLVMDMHALRGREISLREALEFCDLENIEPIEENEYYKIHQQLSYLQEIQNEPAEEETILKAYPRTILNRYVFDLKSVDSWIKEGITIDSMSRFGVKYDPISNAITIPYFGFNGDLVGVRGRFLSPDAYAKYMPMRLGKEMLSHPTSKVLYGLYQNKETIKELKRVILFEGEKSVLKMESIYGAEYNFAVAISGRNFSKDHMKMLIDLGVSDIIVAFDRDYKSHKEINKEIEDMNRMFGAAKNFFNISLILDWDMRLSHKNSPIDQGREIFETLLQNRYYL